MDRPVWFTRRAVVLGIGTLTVVGLGLGAAQLLGVGTYCGHELDPALHPSWNQTDGPNGESVTITHAAGEPLPAGRVLVIVDEVRVTWAERSTAVELDETVTVGANLTLTGLEPGDEVRIVFWDSRPPEPQNQCSSTANFTLGEYVVE